MKVNTKGWLSYDLIINDMQPKKLDELQKILFDMGDFIGDFAEKRGKKIKASKIAKSYAEKKEKSNPHTTT